MNCSNHVKPVKRQVSSLGTEILSWSERTVDLPLPVGPMTLLKIDDQWIYKTVADWLEARFKDAMCE